MTHRCHPVAVCCRPWSALSRLCRRWSGPNPAIGPMSNAFPERHCLRIQRRTLHRSVPPLPACANAAPDEILIVNNASTDRTAQLAGRIPGVRVVNEPRKGLVLAREAGRPRRRATAGLRGRRLPGAAPLARACRASFPEGDACVAVTGPYRFYDWDCRPSLVRAYDHAGAARAGPRSGCAALGAILYGGNFAVRRDGARGDWRVRHPIDFHGEDTNLGRRLAAVGRVRLSHVLPVHVGPTLSGDGRAACSACTSQLLSEILRHRPRIARTI